MSENNLKEKISAYLGKVNSEPEAVYLLVQIRKLLEVTQKKERYEVLNFYGNWVVHSQISLSQLADEWVREINAALEIDPFSTQATDSTLSEYLSLSTFRDELKHFLVHHKLPTDLCASDSKWRKFEKWVLKAVEATPVLLKAPPKRKKKTNKTKKQSAKDIWISGIYMSAVEDDYIPDEGENLESYRIHLKLNPNYKSTIITKS